MKIEEIGDPIAVLAAFSGGQAQPKRFRWKRRTYDVDEVNAHWVDRQCDGYALHYSVQIGDETYHIHFASSEVQWWLDQIAVDG